MIVKIKKTRDFAAINNAALCDKRLSYRARGVLAYLLSKPNNWKVMSEDIVNNGTEGRDAIRACFRELKGLGYARLMAQPGEGRWWVICEDPVERLESRLSGKPEKVEIQQNQKSGKSDTTKKEKKSTKKDDLRAKLAEQQKQIADRMAAIFKRRPNTPWSEKEIRAWKKLTDNGNRLLSDDELTMVERYYAEARRKSDNYCRRDLLTFLNNYPGELDRATSWCEKHPLPGARKIVRRKDAPILETALASRPPEMDPAETKAFCDKFERQFHRLPAGYKRDGEEIIFVGGANGAHAK